MKRLFALALLCTAAGAAACDEHASPERLLVAEPTASPFSVMITGPHAIYGPGFYEWTALVQGADGGDLTYEWAIGSQLPPLDVLGMDGPVLALSLDDYFEGTLEISVIVRSGDHAVLAVQTIVSCPTRHAVDWCFPVHAVAR